VLLIGETGVGKSTWINAFANYIKFSSLEEAVKAGGVFPIKCDFQLRDPQTQQMISISSEGSGIKTMSQLSEIGESVTDMPSEYNFQYESSQINLIDTPGLMDTKDTAGTHDTDREHVNNILRLLSTYDEIHAICILLNGNTNRLSNTFKYTLTELLKHLDTGACNNVIFVFTHTNTKSDQTQVILERFLEEKNLLIPLPPDKPTIYCFDNDTVRYLAQCKNNIPQAKDDKDDAQRNWKRSLRSATEMFGYVSSLKPHSVAGIKEMYNAEHTTRILSKLVLETLMCICKDEDELQAKAKEAEAVRTEIIQDPAKFAQHDLKALLFVKETKVIHTPLDHTIVICESPKCAIIVRGERVYPQICCKNCDSLMIYWCASMNYAGKCKECGCGKKKHQWRQTETKKVTETVYQPDESVIGKIVDSNGALSEINRTIGICQNRLTKYKDETTKMLITCIKLNSFVRQNALMSPDDALLTSLQNEIETYERAGAGANTATPLKYLKQIQNQYQHYLATEIKKGDTKYDVHELIQQLYKLPMKGKDLEKAMEDEEKAIRKVVRDGRRSVRILARMLNRTYTDA